MPRPLGLGIGIPTEISDVVNLPSVLNASAVAASTAGAGGLQFVSNALGPTQTGALVVSNGASNKIVPTEDLVTGVSTYTAISTNQNNVNIGANSDIFVDVGANFVSITGFAGGWQGRRLRVWFKTALGGITFTNESASSTAANRLSMPAANNAYIFDRDGLVEFIYDGDSQRWRPIYLPVGEYYGSFVNGMGANNLTLSSWLKLASRTVGTLPTASSNSEQIFYVSDANGGNGGIARSNGSTWWDLTQNRVVSTAAVFQQKACARFVCNPVSISKSNNIASIVRNSDGLYTITFSQAMVDANYLILATAESGSANLADVVVYSRSTTAFSLASTYQNGLNADPVAISFAVIDN